MSSKTSSTTSKQPEVIGQEESSDPPPQGPLNVVRVVSKKGKVIVVKREADQEIEYKQELEKPDLCDFKLRPIEKLKEASQRKYEVVGICMEPKYDEMTESEEEHEVAKLTPAQKMRHKEMKDLMSIQGRLKGQIQAFRNSGICNRTLSRSSLWIGQTLCSWGKRIC